MSYFPASNSTNSEEKGIVEYVTLMPRTLPSASAMPGSIPSDLPLTTLDNGGEPFMPTTRRTPFILILAGRDGAALFVWEWIPDKAAELVPPVTLTMVDPISAI